MKTPISYYGGKQTMLRHILPMFPEHQLYTEAFAGGAAVFWSKQPSAIEVINDRNGELMNFYEVIKTRMDELSSVINATLCSRRAYLFASIVYNHPYFFDKIKRAWAVWVLCNQGFASQIDNTWGYSRKPTERGTDSTTLKIENKRIAFSEKDEHGLFVLSERLKLVQLECNDAVKVIQSRDCEWAFHYIDPPYINSNQGHYAGYTEDDFTLLLEALKTVKGKFLLSCYDGVILQQYAKENGWIIERHEKSLCASKVLAGGKRSTKIECLTRNY